MPNTSHRRPRPGSTARGLGHDHQRHRARLIARHVDGTACWWCGAKMYRDPMRNFDGRPLHADHTRSRSSYGVGNTAADRLLHATCNEARGDGSRDDRRPVLTGTGGERRHFDPELGQLILDWP